MPTITDITPAPPVPAKPAPANVYAAERQRTVVYRHGLEREELPFERVAGAEATREAHRDHRCE